MHSPAPAGSPRTFRRAQHDQGSLVIELGIGRTQEPGRDPGRITTDHRTHDPIQRVQPRRHVVLSRLSVLLFRPPLELAGVGKTNGRRGDPRSHCLGRYVAFSRTGSVTDALWASSQTFTKSIATFGILGSSR